MTGLLSDSMVGPQVSFDQLQAGELNSETRELNIVKPGSDQASDFYSYGVEAGGWDGKDKKYCLSYGKSSNF